MRLLLLDGMFSVCKLPGLSGVDFSAPFLFFAKTDDEISLVCRAGDEPPGCLAANSGWRALRVAGILDFSLTGVLSALTAALAKAGVPVFAFSTYDTDYIFIKEDRLPDALAALRRAGHTVG